MSLDEIHRMGIKNYSLYLENMYYLQTESLSYKRNRPDFSKGVKSPASLVESSDLISLLSNNNIKNKNALIEKLFEQRMNSDILYKDRNHSPPKCPLPPKD
jgi:hypothetical protein